MWVILRPVRYGSLVTTREGGDGVGRGVLLARVSLLKSVHFYIEIEVFRRGYLTDFIERRSSTVIRKVRGGGSSTGEVPYIGTCSTNWTLSHGVG